MRTGSGLGTRAAWEQLRVLVCHFLRGFFATDLLPFEDQRREVFIAVFVIFAVLGGAVAQALLYPFMLYLGITPRMVANIWLYVTCFLSIGMALAGLLAVTGWERLAIERRDAACLLPLPLARGVLVGAKYLALLAVASALSLSFNLLAVLLFADCLAPLCGVGFLRMAGAHLVACGLANLFVVLAVSLVHLLLLGLAGERIARVVGPALQSIVLLAIISSVVWFPMVIPTLPAQRHAYSTFFAWFPPLWFVGLYHRMLGSADPAFAIGAETGFAALALVLCGQMLALPLVARRLAAPTAPRTRRRRPGRGSLPLTRLTERMFIRDEAEAAYFRFSAFTLRRSPTHRTRLATYAALPVGYAVANVLTAVFRGGWQSVASESVLLASLPPLLFLSLACATWLLAGVPVALESNWVLRVNAGVVPGSCVRGYGKAVAATLAAPLGCAVLVFYWGCLGLVPALRMTAYAGGLAALFLTVAVTRIDTLPLVSARSPNRLKLSSLWAIYLFGFLGCTLFFAALGSVVVVDTWNCVLVVAALVASAFGIARLHRGHEPASALFEEEAEPALITLFQDR